MEDEESNSTSIKTLVVEIGKPTSNKQRKLLSELEEDGNARDDEDEDEDDDEEEEKIKSSREIGESSKQEIIKELKNIQRQNRLTHYLLTASILVTLAWQLSEFSLILRIKQGFNNPLEEQSKASSISKILLRTSSSKYRLFHQPIFRASRSPIGPISTPATTTTKTTTKIRSNSTHKQL